MVGLPATTRETPVELAETLRAHAASELQSDQREAGILPVKVTELVFELKKLCFGSGASASLFLSCLFSSSAGPGPSKERA